MNMQYEDGHQDVGLIWRLLSLVIILCIVAVLGVSVYYAASYLTSKTQPPPDHLPSGYVAFNPDHMVCSMFSMKGAGWLPVLENDQKHSREAVVRMRKLGKAEWREAQTLHCRQRDSKGLANGVEFVLRQEWYQPTRLPGRAVGSTD